MAVCAATWIVAIPGTRKLERLDENIGSDSVDLTEADLQTINDAASRITVQGARLPEHVLSSRMDKAVGGQR